MRTKDSAPIQGAKEAGTSSSKDTYKTQYDKVLAAFSEPKTMLMVARETGIERANVCRYVATAIKLGSLFLVSYSFCAITFHVAGYYSTDRTLVKIPVQLELFDEKGGLYEE